MKKLLALFVAGAFFAVAAPAMAADNPQQEKMKACNAQAGDKKGDERKAFMSTCLKAKPAKAEEQDVDVQQEDGGNGEGRARQGPE